MNLVIQQNLNKADLSCENICWYTPASIIEAAILTMDGITLDPASDEFGNRVIKAPKFFTEAEDGLQQTWLDKDKNPSKVFLNPPSKKTTGNKSLAQLFWNKLEKEYLIGNVREAIFLVVSTKGLAINPSMFLYPMCFTTATATDNCVTRSGRIKFNDKDGKVINSPTQTNAFIYLPPLNLYIDTARFTSHFRRFGICGIFKIL